MSGAGRASWKLLALGGLFLASLVATPWLGSAGVSPGDVLAGDATARTILLQLRLPRVLLALLGGGALSLAGLAFQTLFRNPLAEPYTLGVAGGAALGAVLALQLGGLGLVGGFPAVALLSFAGAAAVTGFLLALARSRAAAGTATLLLAGVAISFTASALILFIQYLADFTKTFRMVRWMMGGLSVVGYGEVLWVLPWTLLGTVVLLRLRWELNLLFLGEEIAASRGMDLRRTRTLLLAVTSGMVAALVAVTGPIGFIGLLVPHILRRWLGHDHLLLVPACLLGGGAFLAWCDLAARLVLAPAQLPVGVLTALLGGPFFLWLLVRRRRLPGLGWG